MTEGQDGLVDLIVPIEQEGTKAVVRTWFKFIGEQVCADEPLVELETDKVAVEVAAPSAGVLVERLLSEGDEAEPGTVLGRLRVGDVANAITRKQTGPGETAPIEPAEAATGTRAFSPELRLSPSVRRLLTESGMAPQSISGTGRDGRLTREDVVGAIANRVAAPAAAAPPTVQLASALPAAAATSPATTAASQRIPHTAMRRRIADHMAHSLAAAPHVTAVFEADFSAIMAHRTETRASFENRGVSLTYTAYIVCACVQAMVAAPTVNSRWHEDDLEVFGDINVGVGTALGDKGLIVPVVHRAQSLSLLGIAQRLQDMTERARAGKLAPADVQGGTFSISNHGVSGSLVAAPIIINQPQSAILGVGKLEKRVVVRQVGGVDAIQIRPMAFVSLSIDHRVLDGAQTNAWLTRFVQTLESWPAAHA